MTRRDAIRAAGVAGIAASGIFPAATAEAAVGPEDAWKVLDGTTGKEVRWRDLPGRLSEAHAIFLGEFHDDPETHLVEAALLEAVHKKVGDQLTLAMEMFERDGQAALTDYLTGKIDEAALGKAVRLWPNYPTDYRPMIEYAKTKRVPVLASNAPQRIVRKVGQEGIKTLEGLTPEDKLHVAAYVNAPAGDVYATRFTAVMSGNHGPNSNKMDPAMIRRFYEAQCVRDDTMAETVVRALEAGRTVLHVNGSFHSDAGLGTAGRVLWRRPLGTRLSIVKIVPFKDKVEWEPLRGEADYLVFVPDRRPAAKDASK
jgi:uncharacterized iron-regulated protein